MSKLRKAILIIGILVIAVAASLGTALALYATGSMKTDPIELEFKLKEPLEAKVYDGTPLKLSRVDFDNPQSSDIELSKGSLSAGHSIKVEFVGSQTDVGTSMCDANIKIYDKNGFNVTNDYSIKVIGAELTVVQKTISVELPSQKVVYNGSKVLFTEYTTEGELVAGHRIYGSTEASLINVGDTLPADLTPLIFDVAGNDVTANYDINFNIDNVNIEVVPRPLKLRPVSYEKVYDGVEIVTDDIEFVEGTLVEGQTVEFEINHGYANTLKDVGEVETLITALKIYDKIGEEKIDVTENYEFNLEEYNGLLKVTPRPLTVVAKSATFVYNGEKQSLKDETEAEAVEGLVEGEELFSVAYISSRTDVGITANKIGEVTLKGSVDNYEITLIDGTLEITPFEMMFKTNSAEKFYDGDPLYDENRDYSVAKSGHGIVIAENSQIPTIINVGEIPNAYEVSVVDWNNGNEDCTANYAITYDYGTLTVKRLPVKVTLLSGENEREKVNYDSKTHAPTLGTDGENSDYFSVEPILKEGESVAKFELDYTAFDTVAETRTMCDAGTYYYSVKFKDGEQEERKLYSNYELFVPESGALEITPLPVTVTLKKYSGGDAFTYSGKAIKLEVTDAIKEIAPSDSANLPEDVEFKTLLTKEDFTVVKREIRKNGETEYTVITDEILDAGENYVYSVKIADASIAKNFDVAIDGLEEGDSGVKLTVKAMPVTVTLSDVEHTYNGEVQTVELSETLVEIVKTEPLSEDDDVTETGLTAGSLVVVYGNGNRTDAKDYVFDVDIAETKKKLKNNYELTVKIDGDDSRNYAKLTINKFDLEVTTDTCEFVYNGKDQSSGAFTNGELANGGHKAERATSDSSLPKVQNVNDVKTNKFDVVVFDGDTDVTTNYNVKYKNGTLSVKPCPLTVTTGSATRAYNGMPLKSNVTVSEGLISGHKINAPEEKDVPSSQTDVGTEVNVFDFDILSGTKSVKNNYDITYIYGTLEVTLCPITLKTDGGEKIYDGTPLSNGKVTIEEDALKINFVAQPKLAENEKQFSITDAGSVENIFACEILTNGGAVVTDNFEISFSENCGMLVINPLAVTFELNDFATNNLNVDMEYDGTPKKFKISDAISSITEVKEYRPNVYTVKDKKTGTGIEFAESDFEIVYSAPLIDAGSYLYTVRFTDETFRNNFKIENEEEQLSCTVRVKQRKLKIELKSYTDDAALVFDNRVQELEIFDALTVTDIDGNAADMISVDDFVLVYPEQLLNAGDYKYKVKIEDESFARNFFFGDPEGDVTVEQFTVRVSLKSYTQTYSGEEFEFIPEDAVKITRDSALSYLLQPADFILAATDGSRIIKAHTYEYGATLADETKARNFRIDVVVATDYGATVEIEKAEVTVLAKPVFKEFNNKAQSIENAEALDLSKAPLITFEDFEIKSYLGDDETALFDAGEYTFRATLTNDNFCLSGNESGVIEGTAEVGKYTVTVTLNDFAKVYDGKEYAFNSRTAIFAVDGDMFGANDFKVAYDEETPLADHSDAGDYTLKAELSEKYDKIKDNVIIVTENNVFTISKKQITLTTQTESFEYDGAEHSAYDNPVLSGAVKGHYAAVKENTIVKVTDVASAPYVNSTEYEIYAVITDGDGNETEKKVTGNYEIEYVNGTLEVTKLAVTVTTGSASREYNGSELSSSEVTCNDLLEGHMCIAPEVLIGITEVGTKENRYVTEGVTIVDGNNRDVTGNYEISYDYGVLEIKAIAIEVTFVEGAQTDYTGSDINLAANAVIGLITKVNASSEGAEPQAEDFEVIFDGEVVNAGTYAFTVAIKSGNHPERYEISPAVGSLTVNKLRLNVTLKNYTDDLAREYTGKAHKLTESDATVDQSAANNPDGITGRDLTFTCDEEMLNAGEYTYGAEITDETLRGNYTLNVVSGGEYVIVPAEITVTLKNYEETYGNANFTIDVYDAIESIDGGLKAMLGKSDFAPKYVESLRIAGNHSYEVEIADAVKRNNFNLSFDGGSFKINKRKLVVVFTGLELSEREFAEGYGSNEYATDFDITKCISISNSTPVANGDSFRVIYATAEGLGDNMLGLYTIEQYELTNENCYDFVNLDGETPLTAKLKITEN